jgi:hypothetical protein
VATIHTGKVTGTAAARWWIAAQDAQRVATGARRLAGEGADAAKAIAAVMRSAGALGATLTPDDIALARAANSMLRLDAMLHEMGRDGTLREFNRRYAVGRAAAKAEGRGFMTYEQAMARLKRALIPGLTLGKPITGLFAEVFQHR